MFCTLSFFPGRESGSARAQEQLQREEKALCALSGKIDIWEEGGRVEVVPSFLWQLSAYCVGDLVATVENAMSMT